MAGKQKPHVLLMGRIPLVANEPFVWKFTAGTRPYQTVASVYWHDWQQSVKTMMQEDWAVAIEIVDGDGTKFTIRELTILEEVPSNAPNIVSFRLSDTRWRWEYQLVARDFNIPKKTGDKNHLNEERPDSSALAISADVYDYRAYSLRQPDTGSPVRWTAREAVESVLDDVVVSRKRSGRGWHVASFPIKDGGKGTHALQNVILRGNAQQALERILSYVPAASLYIDHMGDAVLMDATDLSAVENRIRSWPHVTWDGQRLAKVDRAQTRPRNIVPHYTREMEALFKVDENYDDQNSRPNDDEPWMENVIPTVDPYTDVVMYIPETGVWELVTDVPAGTWVAVRDWLDAMNAIRPDNSLPWTFDTIKRFWFKGDLEGYLGAGGKDLDKEGNVALRVQALREHFRRTYRINPRYTERIREFKNVRAALLDPVEGKRALAGVWGQACVVPSSKGQMVAPSRSDEFRGFMYRNVDYYTQTETSGQTATQPPGPASVDIKDQDLGIVQINWLLDPAGTEGAILPCNVVDENNSTKPKVATRDLGAQDEEPMGPGMRVGTNGLWLSATLKMSVMITVIPAAPNSKKQFFARKVPAREVHFLNRGINVLGGKAEDYEVYIPPGEVTARYAWDDDEQASDTLAEALGVTNPENEEPLDMAGYVLVNEEREIKAHATAVALEYYTAFADAYSGTAAVRLSDKDMGLVGNMSGLTIRANAAPSNKVMAFHEFPGQLKPYDRHAALPSSAQHLILGILALGKGTT